MSFRQKIKQIFSNRHSSSPATLETGSSSAQPAAHSNTPSPSPTFAIRKTKTDRTTKAAKEAQKREKRERKEQKKREKRNSSKPKIELYKPHEIPPSKYRGPRDEAHQRRLNAYTFNLASSSARVAPVSSPELSPRATVMIPSRRGSDASGKIGPVVLDVVEGGVGPGPPHHKLQLHHPLSPGQGCDEFGSEPTTMVDTDGDSANRSRLTLQTERTVVEVGTGGDDGQKPTNRPFSPEQLTEALNATKLQA